MTSISNSAIVVCSSCIVSIFGSLAIIVTLLVFPAQLRKSGHQLLCLLSVADLLTSISYMVNVLSFNGPFCEVMAVIDIYFPVASFLWTDCIAIFVYVSVTRLRRVRGDARCSEKVLFRWFHVVCWGLPVSCPPAHGGGTKQTRTGKAKRRRGLWAERAP
jgi:hypothetical protein